MAIIQNYNTEGLRFGDVNNLYQESLLQENYISDSIKAYGVNIRYWKLKNPYPEVFKPILDSRMLGVHAYGEDFAQEWEDPIKTIAYIKFEQDDIVLNAYGVYPNDNLSMWMNQTDFAISMARKLSQWKEYKVVGNSEFILDFDSDQDLISNRNNIYMRFSTDLFNGSLQAILTDEKLNSLLTHDSCSLQPGQNILLETPIIIPCKVVENGKLKIDTGRINPLLYKGNHYDPFEDDLVDSHLHLEVVSILKDRSGTIRIMGGIRGAVIYHDTTVVGKYLDKITPEVGDLIDIPLPSQPGKDEVWDQKYEIVNIVQTSATENFMNPFLRKYIYQMNLRAYVSSGQEEPNGPSEKQVELKDKLDLINIAAEDAAKKIGLYEDGEDSVFGGYQKINKRSNPSVQRDVSKSTINNFDPPTKTKGLRKTTTHLFRFKDLEMVVDLVDDPKNNNSYLKLSPAKKSTKIDKKIQYLDYLRADDDTLCLVNGIQSYLLASKYKQMEIDDSTYCLKPIRLKHEVYAQKNGWADQPFHLVDADDDNKLDLNLQDLIGKNTTDRNYKSASENRITFPYTNTYLECEYEQAEDDDNHKFEIWTCYVVLKGDQEQNHIPICSYIKK